MQPCVLAGAQALAHLLPALTMRSLERVCAAQGSVCAESRYTHALHIVRNCAWQLERLGEQTRREHDPPDAEDDRQRCRKPQCRSYHALDSTGGLCWRHRASSAGTSGCPGSRRSAPQGSASAAQGRAGRRGRQPLPKGSSLSFGVPDSGSRAAQASSIAVRCISNTATFPRCSRRTPRLYSSRT